MADDDQRSRFERVVMPHLDAAYNLARWLSRDAHDAEDIAQEALLRAYRYFGALRGADARPWLLAIVRRSFYDWLSRNRPAEIDRGVDPESLADETGAIAGPEQAALRRADNQSLTAAIAALPRGFREVLVLRELEELSYKQIAHIVAIPIGTVMSRLARARGLLQKSPLLESVRAGAAGGER